MPHFYETLPLNLQGWALDQSVFFTASAPTYGHHINLSPKGVPSSTFFIFDESHAAYLDLTGSGAETISHIYENGRVTVMFCSFSDKPRILRLYCTGRVMEYDHPDFQQTITSMKLANVPGTRAVVLLDIWKVQTSCGYAVPIVKDSSDSNESVAQPHNGTTELAEWKNGEIVNPPCKCFHDRHMLERWLVNKINKKALDDYMIQYNSRSLDWLPGLRQARRMKGESVWLGDACRSAYNHLCHPMAVLLGMIMGFVISLAFLQLSSSSGSLNMAVISLNELIFEVQTIIYKVLVLAERGWITIAGCPNL